jgi:predicted trehalose synthase
VLRSFDYARAVGNADPAWAEDAREALLAGYGARDEAATALLGALELDKALYEAVYEARNRPHWSPIPLGALDRLLGG